MQTISEIYINSGFFLKIVGFWVDGGVRELGGVADERRGLEVKV